MRRSASLSCIRRPSTHALGELTVAMRSRRAPDADSLTLPHDAARSSSGLIAPPISPSTSVIVAGSWDNIRGEHVSCSNCEPTSRSQVASFANCTNAHERVRAASAPHPGADALVGKQEQNHDTHRNSADRARSVATYSGAFGGRTFVELDHDRGHHDQGR